MNMPQQASANLSLLEEGRLAWVLESGMPTGLFVAAGDACSRPSFMYETVVVEGDVS